MIEDRIERARGLLERVHYAAMATVNEDGSPHNTPIHFIISDSRKYIYWASSPASQHSKNLNRSGQAFFVIYEPGVGGGLYLQTRNGHELTGAQLKDGLNIWNKSRMADGKPELADTFFKGNFPQRMYRVDIMKSWVNCSDRDKAGNIIRDYRYELAQEDLLLR
ncbi:MAG: pyridoxamine 5'-phosphate oxidase family protein [Candidatus Saccharimonadales bacterium]